MRGKRATGRNMPNLNHDQDASPQAREERARARRDNREQSTRRWPLHGGGCWCGEPFGHDWPGKAAGSAHPREERFAVMDEVAGGRW